MKSELMDCRSFSGSNGQNRKKLGVIGGMGPAATALFFGLLTKNTHADRDQDHLETYIISRPAIPDRTAFILGKSKENPVPAIIETGNKLVELGADVIAIPCLTSHFFYDELSEGIHAPIIHLVREIGSFLHRQGISRAGLMATDGVVQSGLFHTELDAFNIRTIAPSPDKQRQVMDLVYNSIKANKPFDLNTFLSIENELRENGAQSILLACTELSLIKRDCRLSAGYVDALEVLAMRCIEICGACTVDAEV